jgi:hypothetical protein
MKNDGVELEKNKSLEDWLCEQNDSCFPPIGKLNKSYSKKYDDFKCVLGPVHDSVEKGAMIKDIRQKIVKYKEELEENKDGLYLLEDIEDRLDALIIIYLNGHGKAHVDKVIEKISEIVSHFKSGHLTPYEGFFLLCAAQAHDIGNLFGRENHEKSCKIIVEEKADNIIQDRTERDEITRLAMVHGGTYFGNPDTIDKLQDSRILFNGKIREKMLAAILRFADELADDVSRADSIAIEMGVLGDDDSLIYHKYSESLHTVSLDVDRLGKIYICLNFSVFSDDVLRKMKKNKVEKYLLDEIYDRTIKMENERRYCMRFMRPYLSIDYISVEIFIMSQNGGLELDRITYTIKEEGYPIGLKCGGLSKIMPNIKTGQEECEYIKGKINS